ncbi:MAG TPA: hypothetical protein PK830_02630 [Candidatus Atribacteria bacterium]|nr:hypothetical protein [Candidatus Atribacteria bacterium]HPT77988.1 hypothetical protein [Candidatus Atribacteria bacterium]
MWVSEGRVLSSYGLFALISASFFIIVNGLTINNDRLVLKDISYGSFGAFIIITLTVALILSEGEILDGLDIPVEGSKKSKKPDMQG